ncbi:glycosyl hydrolase [bacterium]|nr:glycosyl hydrolase [bacterium]
MKNIFTTIFTLVISIFIVTNIYSQDKEKEIFSSETFSGLELRSIGPSFKSGRIADIAIHPENNNIWYVAVGSGGVWKTTNSGTTFTPVFDDQPVYSIGCVTIDPRNPHTIWVGTGENVGGRHVGYGDGVYRSRDGGSTWENMGLKESQHISKIIVHPNNSDVIWVAAQGPLWNKGGERGLYKSIDGGKNWKKVLGDDEWVGVTDVVIDPRNADRMYAATWQRHRNVAAYMGGGPGTAIYKSNDGGESWEKMTKGLPTSNMGKIGLAISPQKPDVIYAAIELDRRTGGVYRSNDRGASWTKMSEAVSGATGPHYYQELYASPHQFDRIYLVDVRIQVSDDGGKTFKRLKEQYKHSDNHVIAFRPDEPDYLLIGTDGGVYESFDLAENWRFIENLPLTQYYKLAVDDTEPFYKIYGGTQDNGTQGGPSRTLKSQGISNEEWDIVLGADGHQPATEPGNPDIIYAEWQEGNLMRIDMTNGEQILIKPQPEEGEDYERFNWDSPILVSPHSPTTIYFASQRVWKSDDRGDSWQAISEDLTKDQERITLPIMDQSWSWDAPWDINAMSNYNTITSLAESPKQEGLIYAGTDDGRIQVTENGGVSWRKIDVGSLPGVPETAFVNDIKADLFDANTVYVALDNHKYGDLNPYLFKSIDRGKSWKSIKGNIPDKTLIWRIVQDHINPDLLFAGTEFGIYFTVDGGKKWVKLSGGVPTISFRDLAIQRRENDLVGASFGRSFYVFDDYSVLRHVSEEQLKEEAGLFPVRDTWWYMPKRGKGKLGASDFIAPNPPFGAVFTYYLSEGYKTDKEIRQEKEKEQLKNDETVTFPGWNAVEAERRQSAPTIWLTVTDEKGNIIRKIEGPASKGFHRVAWDLRYPIVTAIDIHQENNASWGFMPMTAPGTYSVSLFKEIDGVVTPLSKPVSFNVKQLQKGALEGSSPEETVAFWKDIQQMQGKISATSLDLNHALKKVNGMELALARTELQPGELDKELSELRQKLFEIEERLNGNHSKNEIGEKNNPTIKSRLNSASNGVQNATYGPTETAQKSLEIAEREYDLLKKELDGIINERIPTLEMQLEEAGAPEIKG